MELTQLQRVKKLCKWLIFSGYGDKEADIAILLSYNVSSFSQFLNAKKPITDNFIDKICGVDPNVNKLYIAEGVGSFFLNENFHKKEQKNLIPLYDGVVTAGMEETAVLEHASEPVEMVDAGDWFRDATAAMRVHGDSMYPEYKSGSIVALKEVYNKRLVVYGQDYLIETSEYRVIKRLQRSDLQQNWLACSINEEKYESSGRLIHEPFDVHIDDVIRLYQVVGNVRRNQSSRIVYNNSIKN